jgi:hypothetical protein
MLAGKLRSSRVRIAECSEADHGAHTLDGHTAENVGSDLLRREADSLLLER